MGADGIVNCERLTLLEDAVRNVLGTENALRTYAQIIDGLPSSKNADLYNEGMILRSHPILLHEQLCPGAIEKAETYRTAFDIKDLSFDSEVLQKYYSAPTKTHQFGLRLIELTVVAIHQIAVYLFQQRHRLHDPATTNGLDIENVTDWSEPQPNFPPPDPRPTLFMHGGFSAIDQYPNGLADCIGYWAEDSIIGGVALFDRSRSWTGTADEPNVYFESGRAGVTARICQLLNEQQDQFVDFLTADAQAAKRICPLPILPDMNNRVRIDSDDAITVHKVYRDLWERRLPEQVSPLTAHYRAISAAHHRSRLDYPEDEDVMTHIERLNQLAKDQRGEH